ncbi:uncharacterized protein [Drosophila takahashii]|uniref:uncharacterized protein n=1 Tax=Drosophila takahashii TaxID=29030 RepID=UPI001CF88BF0|nr:uncharacterized protein LOC108066800 [Drosophila takahashii]
MFTKGKPRTPLANNQAKFKGQLANNGSQLSFSTAAQALRKNSSQLRQTKLSVCRKNNKLKYDGFAEEEEPKMRPKKEFVYIPTPSSQEKSRCEVSDQKDDKTGLPSCPMSKPGRNLVSLIGRVDFCLKTHKINPDINAIWNVYGKLLRIFEGKRGEHLIIVRDDGSKSILQGIYYDFEGVLKTWSTGGFVHLVGHFIRENRLQIFSIAQVSDILSQQQFMRIENVTTYVLMQNNVHK